MGTVLSLRAEEAWGLHALPWYSYTHTAASATGGPVGEPSGGADTVADVKTTTVRLPDDVADALEGEAKRQGVSASELVREGVILRLVVAAALRAGRTDVLDDLVRQLERLR